MSTRQKIFMLITLLTAFVACIACDDDEGSSLAPVIDSITASNGATVIKTKPNQSIGIIASITDDNGISQFIWEVLGDCGSIDTTNTNTTVFHAADTTGTCTVQLTVIDYSGNSVSQTVDIEITEFAAMTEPVFNFQAVPTTGKIELIWENPDDNNFGGVVLCYSETDYYSTPDECGEYELTSGSNQSYEHTQLAPSGALEDGQKYFYTLFTKDKDNNFLQPLTESAMTIPKAGSFAAASASASSIDLSWSTPSYSNIAGVKVVYGDSEFPQTPDQGFSVYSGSDISTTATGLTTHKAYFYSLFVMDADGNYSEPMTELEGPKYSIVVITDADGLAGNYVEDVLVSPGSDNLYVGINNANGLSISPNRNADPMFFNNISVGADVIHSLYESTTNGYLYAGGSNGLSMTQDDKDGDGSGTWFTYNCSTTPDLCINDGNSPNTNDDISSLSYHDGRIYIGIESKNTWDGGLIYSGDNGSTWNEITEPTLPSNSIISMDEMNGTLFAGTHNDDLLSTADGGINWTQYDISSIVSSKHITAIFCDENSNSVYVGTTSGLAISTDGGYSWTGHEDFMETGASNVIVSDIEVVNNNIYVATEQGALVSIDGGDSWIGYTSEDGIPASTLNAISVDSNNGAIYIATNGGGLAVAKP